MCCDGKKPKKPVPTAPPPPVFPCPTCLALRITEIVGLYKPGVDERAFPDPGTTQAAGYYSGYTSADDKGRIYINSVPGHPPLLGNAVWTKNKQYIEITVLVDPPTIAIPPGSKITWTFTDPDDPSNEGPDVRPDAGFILDPNDYSGSPPTKAGKNAGDNDPHGKAQQLAHFEQAEAKYPLSGGNETLVDIPSRTSKVRFNISDIGGDNWKITAKMTPIAPITLVNDVQTGVMTAWNRVQVEYVKMASAAELPLDQLPVYYDKAFVQMDVSKKTIVTGIHDKDHFGTQENAADNAIAQYAKAPPDGVFTNEKRNGWFFIAAANRRLPYAHANVLYEGNATANGTKVTLPAGTRLSGTPFVVRVFEASKIVGVPAPKPDEPVVYLTFLVAPPAKLVKNELTISPHDFHKVDDPDNSFLDADLTTYGFAAGSSIPIQILSRGENAVVVRGISPGGKDVPIPGRPPGETHHLFGGKLVVFTKSMPGPGGGAGADIRLLCHELCHAFDNAHKCGNWDWQQQAALKSCCMNYWIADVLNDATPRAPIPWSENRMSPHLCAPHLRHIRDYHLEDNEGFGWVKP